MPSLQQLRYLVALDSARHFRRAAELCNVTQPTLSAQLKDLEAKLDCVLVDRARGQVLLTPIGEIVAAHARRALTEVAEIHAACALHKGALQSTIKVGVVQSLGSYLMPLVVPDLHESHPSLKLYMREGLPNHLLEGLASGAHDILLFPLPIRPAEFEVRSLFREPLLTVMPHDHAFAGQADLAPDMLRGETILALERGHRLTEQVELICEQFGAHLSHDYEGTSLDTLRQMVAMGMGLSILPALYVRSEVTPQDIVVARPFRGTPPARTIGMIWRKGTARQAEYIDLSREICTILRRRAPELTLLG